ncbi:unnamed protein product [Discosporangium mesarthrocarpum]
MYQYLKALGRDAAVVNLDPANYGEGLPYEPVLDIGELVSLETVMEEFDLGPNGGMLYCLEYLEKNVDWLVENLSKIRGKYLIFDFPGQVELFTHCQCVQNIVHRLQKEDFRLTAVHLVDAYHCSNPSLFISVTLLSLMVMLRLELPHVNVLSKVDLVEQLGPLPFNLDFFTECQDMSQLLDYMDAPPITEYEEGEEDGERELRGERHGGGTGQGEINGDSEGGQGTGTESGLLRSQFSKMTEMICEVVDSYGLVCFYPLNIQHPHTSFFSWLSSELMGCQDADTVGRVLAQIDKSNGYILGMGNRADPEGAQGRVGGGDLGTEGVDRLFRTAFSDTSEPMFERVAAVQERYMPDSFVGQVPPELVGGGRGIRNKE